MAVSRRTFLVLGGAAVAVPPLGIAGRAATSSPEATISRVLRARLPDMRIPNETLLQFGAEFVQRNRPQSGRRFDGALLIMDNPWMEGLLGENLRLKYDGFVRRMMTDFLFSTDLFTSADGKLSAASYVAFADPYELGCRNPLARFDFDEGPAA